jgi:hypothetical protein
MMSLLFSLFRGFIPAHIRNTVLLIVLVLKRDNLQDLRVNGKKVIYKIDFEEIVWGGGLD